MMNNNFLRYCIISSLFYFQYNFGEPLFLHRYYSQNTKKSFIKNNRCTSFIKGQVLRRSADSFFDENNRKQPLADLIIGEDISVGDIYLLSRLSANGNINLPGNGTNFGNIPSQQYIACLSHAKVNFTARTSEIEGLVRYMRYFELGCCGCLKGSLGAILPIRQVNRKLDYELCNTFISCGTNPLPLGGIGETNVGQFFSDYGDVNDFFKREVIEAKGLSLKRNNKKVGVGDLKILSLLDWTNYTPWAEDFSLGLNFIIPTGTKRSADIIWDSDLGNGGAPEIEFFLSGHFNSCRSYLNPFVYFEGVYSFPFSVKRRVPKKIINGEQRSVNTVDGLTSNVRYMNHVVQPFCEFNSLALEFADRAVNVKIQYGSRLRFICGNYLKNIFDTQITLGFFYDFENEDRAYVRVKEHTQDKFDTRLLETLTDRISHEIGWSASWYYNKQVKFFVGSKHTVGGRRTFAYNKIFISTLLFF